MSSRRPHRSGKAVDRSTQWSGWILDPKGFYYSYRLNENGDTEYQYPDTTPRSEVGTQPTYDSSTPTTTTTYQNNSNYTAEPLPRTLSSDTITPLSYANETSNNSTNTTNARPIPIRSVSAPSTFGLSASAPTGGYSQSRSSNTYGYIPENSTGFYPQGTNVSGYPSNVQYASGAQYGTNNSVAAPYNSQVSHQTAVPTPGIPHKNIAGTTGTFETLHAGFKIHNSSYFEPCKVIKVLWSEPEGNNLPEGATEVTGSYLSVKNKFGENVYTSIRRFVIVAADHAHCQCVPILTYNRRGTAKSGAQSLEHAIVYTGSEVPQNIANEPTLQNKPIKMIPDNPRVKLDAASRVNYSKLYTVEYNVKVMFIGRIAESSHANFIKGVDAAWNRKRKVSGY